VIGEILFIFPNFDSTVELAIVAQQRSIDAGGGALPQAPMDIKIAVKIKRNFHASVEP